MRFVLMAFAEGVARAAGEELARFAVGRLTGQIAEVEDG